MGGTGGAKDPDDLTRRNLETQRAEVERKAAFSLPDIDEGWYHERTVEFWKSIQESEFAGQFIGLDLSGLYMLREMVDGFWSTSDDHKTRLEFAREARLLGRQYGLSPMDRRSLKWKVIAPQKAAAGPSEAAANGTESALERKERLKLVA